MLIYSNVSRDCILVQLYSMTNRYHKCVCRSQTLLWAIGIHVYVFVRWVALMSGVRLSFSRNFTSILLGWPQMHISAHAATINRAFMQYSKVFARTNMKN